MCSLDIRAEGRARITSKRLINTTEMFQMHSNTVTGDADGYINVFKDVHEEQFGSKSLDDLDQNARRIDCILVASEA